MHQIRFAIALFAGAAGTAAALIAGPTAAADPPPGCDTDLGASGDCLTPGDVQSGNATENFTPGDDYGTFEFPEAVG